MFVNSQIEALSRISRHIILLPKLRRTRVTHGHRFNAVVARLEILLVKTSVLDIIGDIVFEVASRVCDLVESIRLLILE